MPRICLASCGGFPHILTRTLSASFGSKYLKDAGTSIVARSEPSGIFPCFHFKVDCKSCRSSMVTVGVGEATGSWENKRSGKAKRRIKRRKALGIRYHFKGFSVQADKGSATGNDGSKISLTISGVIGFSHPGFSHPAHRLPLLLALTITRKCNPFFASNFIGYVAPCVSGKKLLTYVL